MRSDPEIRKDGESRLGVPDDKALFLGPGFATIDFVQVSRPPVGYDADLWFLRGCHAAMIAALRKRSRERASNIPIYSPIRD
jgi:hypothetical protein